MSSLHSRMSRILSIALAAAVMIGATLMSTPACAQIPGDLRWDPAFGLYFAELDGDNLVWPSGTYDMEPDVFPGFLFALDPLAPGFPPPPAPRFSLKNRTNLKIDATGVTIVVTDPSAGVFWLTECHGLKINGLTIRCDPLPYSQGTVTHVDLAADEFDVTLDTGYLGLDDPFFEYTLTHPETQNYGVLYDPVTTLLKAGINGNFCRVESAQSQGAGVYTLKMDSGFHAYLSHFQVNDRFAYVGRRLGRSAIDIKSCEPTGPPLNRPPVTLEACTINASANIAVALRDSPKISSTQGAVIRDCIVEPVSPTELLSTNASLLFAANCRKGPLVEGCWIERESDDAFDIHSDGRYFLGYPLGGSFSVVDLDKGATLAVGDTLQFWDPSTGDIVESSITSLQNIPGSDTDDIDPKRVVLSDPVPGLVVDTDDIDPDRTFIAWNIDTACPGFEITNNDIRDIRGVGARLNTIGGTFAFNTIHGANQGGIVVANDAAYQFRQGPIPRDILIQRNTVKNCGYWVDATKISQGSSILVAGLKGIPANQFSSADSPIVTNVIVQGNVVENWNTMGIFAKGIRDCQIVPFLDPVSHIGIHNKFKGTVAFGSRAVTFGAPAETTTVDGVNTFSASGLQYAVRIESGVAASVTATHISVKTPTLPLQDLR